MIEWHSAVQYKTIGKIDVHDALTVEAPLEIRVNDAPFTMTMRTPGDDVALAWGLVYTEGLVRSADCEVDVNIVPGGGETPDRACLYINPGDLTRDFSGERSILSTSSCGLCGKRDFSEAATGECPIRLPHRSPFDISRVPGMLGQMRAAQETFEHSGGSHAACAFDDKGAMLAIAEDIGRHNAVDKVVGRLLPGGMLSRAQSLLVSGRISYEIVFKAWRAGIPVLLAVSAPSTLSVSTARRLGMTLVAFCRDGRATVYTNNAQVVSHPTPDEVPS